MEFWFPDVNSSTMSTPIEATSSIYRELEIIGLHSPTNGRSCTLHQCCGDHLQVDDIVCLKKTVVTVDGKTEEAIKCVLLLQGREACTIGFIPRVHMKSYKIMSYVNTHAAQIVELYDDSDNSDKRKKSQRNLGMAAAVFLDDIEHGE